MTEIAVNDLFRLTDGNEEEIDKSIQALFTYRPWNDEQIAKGKVVKDALAVAFKAIILNVPSSPSRTRALNALVDARMLVNASISFDGKI